MVQIGPLAGRTLGEYQIERLLGQSQLGAAYIALQPAQGRKVMITTFHLPQGISAQEQEQLRLRITREREVLTKLAHPHILPVYECGIQPGYTYLITAFAKEASLNQLLKQNARFSPQHVLPLLKQLAEALDYARSQGMFHGMLSLSNVLVSDELNLRIAGFGLKSLLEMSDSAQHTHRLDHPSPASGEFVGDPEYISPERVLGLAIDGRADVYALGVMLFALLSGTPPFRGAQPLDVALQRLQQPAPSLHAICPDVPEALDIVIGKMLERDPARRTRYAGEVALAFERALKSLDVAQRQGSDNLSADGWQNTQITMPPTVNWFDEAVGISSNVLQTSLPAGGNGLPLDTSFQEADPSPQAGHQATSLGGTDPFLWWSSASTGFQTPPRVPGTFASPPVPGSRNLREHLRSRRVQQDRRRLVKLIVVGSAAGVVTVGGMSLARLVQSQKQSLAQMATTSQPGSTATSGSTTASDSTATASKGTPAPGSKQGATSTPASAKSPTPQPTSSKPSPTAQPKPTQPPPTPTPGHTGTVIGHTNQATNSAVVFTNPANGHASLLIRMANGNFVACEKACTHAGVPCDYSAGSQKLVCPAHGATFDPANGFAPTSPAPSPLPRVSIRVNADGTITTG